MISELWKKDNYINDNMYYLFNKEITEYDMKEGGFSLIQEFKLLDDNTIKELKKHGKDERKVLIGKMQIKDPILKKNLNKDAFKAARKLFFTVNDIQDNDIISIKKDAIITTKNCNTTKIGKFIDFRPKHLYTSYIRLNKKTEIYYSPYDFAVKGIGDNKIEYHEDYMIKFIKLYCKKMETSDNMSVIEFTRNFIDLYKRRELEIGYYREFNSNSSFKILNDENRYMEYWEECKNEIDISYNFFNVLLKLIKIPL